MKNTFKLGFVAFAISLSVAACSSDKKAIGTSDSSSTTMDSTAGTSTTDTTATDSTKKDTTAKM
ncbi:MAG: hypothetical protein EOP43_03990 [Sphingobacteriaceae bacterium]|nr:MAG: hypothetical protein EOP43_03990 [Sphingobacteriaceae bacterium]